MVSTLSTGLISRVKRCGNWYHHSFQYFPCLNICLYKIQMYTIVPQDKLTCYKFNMLLIKESKERLFLLLLPLLTLLLSLLLISLSLIFVFPFVAQIASCSLRYMNLTFTRTWGTYITPYAPLSKLWSHFTHGQVLSCMMCHVGLFSLYCFGNKWHLHRKVTLYRFIR